MRMTTVIGALSLLPILATGASGQFNIATHMLTNKSVQKELDLEGNQVSDIAKAAEAIEAEMRKGAKELREMPREAGSKRFSEMLEKQEESVYAAADRILKPEQVKRFRQICLQSQGPLMLADAAVAKRLKITPAQNKKIEDIKLELSTRARAALALNREKPGTAGSNLKNLRAEINEKLLGVLTPIQKKTWSEMVGAPFTYVSDPRPPSEAQRTPEVRKP